MRSRRRRARRAGLPAPFLCLQRAGNVLAAFAGAAEPRRSAPRSLPPFPGTAAGRPAAERLGEPGGGGHARQCLGTRQRSLIQSALRELDSAVKLVSRSAPSLRGGGCGGKRSGTRTGGVVVGGGSDCCGVAAEKRGGRAVAISELHPVDAGGASAVSVLPLECVGGGQLLFRRCPPEGGGGAFAV